MSIALLALLGSLVSGAPAASAHTAAPADPQASTAAAQTLDWLAHLPGRAGNRVLSGYFGGYANGTSFSLAQTEELKTGTGQYPGLLACDYGSNLKTVGTSCNDTLVQWSQRGGLVSVSAHVPNPVQPDAAGFYTHLDTFDELTDPATATGAAWQRTLDSIADGLTELSDAGVPVLFRPLHEMNMTSAKSFWWSSQRPAEYIAVWRHMFRYLTEERGLHNLLWVYSPSCISGVRTAYYPGDAYVDIAALDCYAANPAAAQGYAELTALGKPFAFSEIGPPTAAGSSVPAPGSFDYAKWIEAIREQFPATTYFLAWNDQWRPTEHQHATELMNDPWTVNLGEIDLAARTEAAGPPRPAAPVEERYGFEGTVSSTDGWTGYLTQAGPWSVTEWASAGERSLKADIDLTAPASILNRVGTLDLSGYATLTAAVRTAPWGNQAAGTSAKLFVTTGEGKTWYDSGSTVIGTDGAMLTVDLSKVADLDDVREMGVRFAPAVGASGKTAVYVDDVSLTRTPTRLYGFEGDGASSTNGWTGLQTKNGPWSVTEWAAEGSRSLKADVDLTGGTSYLLRNFATPVDLSARTTLAATVRTAAWGDHADGTRAKLYVQSGPDCTWHDGGTHLVGSSTAGTRISYNLTGVADLTQVCRIGVQFVYDAEANAGSAVYVDQVDVR